MNIWPRQSWLQRDSRRAFTLVELLVVIALISLIASATLFALNGAREDAKARRARAEVARIHELLMRPWDSYRTRPVPLLTPPAGNLPDLAMLTANERLRAIRELMRMELPDRKADLIAPAQNLGTTPSLWQAYRRRAARQVAPGDWLDDAVWTPQYQSAECLYLILACMVDGNSTGLDFFSEGEIGDVDNDKMPEILDPWGQPVYFLRWAPGFREGILTGVGSELQKGDLEPTLDTNAGKGNGDPFDPLLRDGRWTDGVTDNDPFVIYPLVVSAGPDKLLDMVVELTFSAFDPLVPPYPYRDPYAIDAGSLQLGMPTGEGSHDNISNHLLEVR